MTLHGELVDTVKWLLCDFYAAQPPLGDSNVEYDFAEKIVEVVTRADKERLAGLVEDGICVKVHDDLYRQGQCNGLREGLERAATIIRNTPIGDERE